MKRLTWVLWCCLLFQATAEEALDRRFPVRGFCIGAPSAAQVDRFVQFIQEELAPRAVNTLILRVDYNYQYVSHPELRAGGALAASDVKKLVAACRTHRMRLIPQINLLGHQSWANQVGTLLRVYPEFDETPWVKMPEKHSWPNPDRLYCKSYCPLHPKVHEVVFALMDEICDVFETDAFHAGLDEVFYLGEERCPRCGGKDKAKLFADEVSLIREHLAQKGRKLWLWGDRLLDGATTGLGEWEASLSGSHRAIDLVPRDVVICDWHYDRPEPTAAYFAMKGLTVVTCPWKNGQSAAQQVRDVVQLREHASKPVAGRVQGIVQTVWSGANGFMDEFYGTRESRGGEGRGKQENTESRCFIATFNQMALLGREAAAPDRERHLLFVGRSRGGQAETVSSAMAMFQRLGRETGLWDTCVSTDGAALTKKPLPQGSRNLDGFDVVVLDVETGLELEASQKADLLAFVREDGKGVMAIHGAAAAFGSWPEFSDLLGGTADGCPWGQFEAPLVVEGADFPGMRSLPRRFTLTDEIYQWQGLSRDRVRVLLSLNAEKLDLSVPGVRRTDKDFPVSWARTYGKGRVLYNGLGGQPAIWERADMQNLWADQVLWAMGVLPGDASPRPKPGSAP